MHRSNFKMRKSLGKVQKQNLPECLNNVQKDSSLTTLPAINLPCNTLNLRQDPPKKTKKLPLLENQKSRKSKSTQHLSTALRLLPSQKAPPKTLPALPSYQINQLENINLVKQYSSIQLQYFLSKESTSDFLQYHDIKGSMRAKMVDWMIQVLCSYKYSEKTFFQAVQLMDNYFTHTVKNEYIKGLHLVGVCCMFIVIKLEEVIPIRLKTVYQKIAHKKLSIETIKNKEEEIFSALNYNVILPTLYDLITTTLYLWNTEAKLTSKFLQQIIQFALHMGKVTCVQYELISSCSKALLSGAAIFLAFKIFKQLHVGFGIQENIEKIYNLLHIDKESMTQSSNRILDLAKNFQQYYPQLTNLMRFSKFDDSKRNIL